MIGMFANSQTRLPEILVSRSQSAQSNAFRAAPAGNSFCTKCLSKSGTLLTDSICAKTDAILCLYRLIGTPSPCPKCSPSLTVTTTTCASVRLPREMRNTSLSGQTSSRASMRRPVINRRKQVSEDYPITSSLFSWLSSVRITKRFGIMKITKNIGMLLLAIYLILDGLLGFGLNLGPAIFLLYLVALAAGVLILIGK